MEVMIMVLIVVGRSDSDGRLEGGKEIGRNE